jgi:uncharacterized protein YegP (UPF0339 family)
MTIDNNNRPAAITCVIYESRRILKWSWRIRFVAANGEILGDDYTNQADAQHAARLIASNDVPCKLQTHYRDGKIIDHVRLR